MTAAAAAGASLSVTPSVHRVPREAKRPFARAGGDGRRARHWLVALSVSVAVSLTSAKILAQPAIPLGTWEYRQRNVASPTGVDPEGERLVIAQAGEQVIITYFGLERAGEHGLYYTAVQATDVRRTKGNLIEFTVPARTLYRTRPETLAHAASLEPAGVANDSLSLTAERRGEALIVTCGSSDRSCPESTMTFRRLPRPK